jgi:hypothetical protein
MEQHKNGSTEKENITLENDVILKILYCFNFSALFGVIGFTLRLVSTL